MFFSLFSKTERRRRASRRRLLQVEPLEGRRLLAAGCPWDVNDSGFVSPLDALLVINKLNRDSRGVGDGGVYDPIYDVNRDSIITPLDALLVINALNRFGSPYTCPAVGPAIVQGDELQPEYLPAGLMGDPVLSFEILGAPDVPSKVGYLGLGVQGVLDAVERVEFEIKVGESVSYEYASRDEAKPGDHLGVLLGDRLVLGPGEEAHVIVRPIIRGAVDGVVEAHPVQFQLKTVEMENADTGEVITPEFPAEGITGPEAFVVFSQITDVVNWGPETAEVPSDIATVGSFHYFAAPNLNDHTSMLDKLVYTVEASNVELSGAEFRLWNAENPELFVHADAVDVLDDGSYVLTWHNLLNSVVETEIQPGTGITLEVGAGIITPQVDPAEEASLQVFAEIGEDTEWLDKYPNGSVVPHYGYRLDQDRVPGTLFYTSPAN